MVFRSFDSKLSQKRKQAEQKIFVRDIVVLQPQKTKGEIVANGVASDKFTLLERIMQHVRLIANIGLNQHLEHNFTNPVAYKNIYQLRDQAEQAIAPITDEMIKQRMLRVDITELDRKSARIKHNKLFSANLLTPDELEVNLDFAARRIRAIEELTRERNNEIAIWINRVGASGDATSSMRDDRLNHITRVITSEFTFYPNFATGPLTENDYQSILVRIEHLAQCYPENLHLLLASFPLVDSMNYLHNIVFYVQCGPRPLIHAFSKAVPELNDPRYPGTLLAPINNIIYQEIEHLRNVINIMLNQIDQNVPLTQTAFDSIRQELLSLANSFRDVRRALTKEVGILKQAFAKIDALNSDAKKREFIKRELHGLLLQMVADLAKHTSLPFANFTEDGTGMLAGGLVEITTAGGAKGSVFVEVCLDHRENVATRMLMRTMADKVAAKQPITNAVSQVITANTVDINVNNLLGKNLVHADRAARATVAQKVSTTWINIQPEHIYNFNLAAFGSSPVVKVFGPQHLQSLEQTYIANIDDYNRIVAAIQALNVYHAQHPKETSAVHARMKVLNLQYYAIVGATNRLSEFSGEECFDALCELKITKLIEYMHDVGDFYYSKSPKNSDNTNEKAKDFFDFWKLEAKRRYDSYEGSNQHRLCCLINIIEAELLMFAREKPAQQSFFKCFNPKICSFEIVLLHALRNIYQDFELYYKPNPAVQDLLASMREIESTTQEKSSLPRRNA